MKLEDLKDKNPAEISLHLQELAPQVLDTRAMLDVLMAEQRAYVQARELKALGLWVGDKIQIIGKKRGLANPTAIVVGIGRWDDLIVNVLKKDGSRREENDQLYSFEKYEKID